MLIISGKCPVSLVGGWSGLYSQQSVQFSIAAVQQARPQYYSVLRRPDHYHVEQRQRLVAGRGEGGQLLLLQTGLVGRSLSSDWRRWRWWEWCEGGSSLEKTTPTAQTDFLEIPQWLSSAEFWISPCFFQMSGGSLADPPTPLQMYTNSWLWSNFFTAGLTKVI